MAELQHISFAEYAKIPAISASALKGIGSISPAHLKAYLDGFISSEDTPDMRFGRAMHSIILEPDTFAENWPVAYPCSAQLASGKRKGEACGCSSSYHDGLNWYCGTHKPENAIAPTDFITEDESKRLMVLRDKLRESPANHYLARKGYSEAVIVWDRCGFKLKTRIDRLAVDEAKRHAVIVDLKKCRVGKATDELMRKECLDRKYHVQAAMNIDAVREVYGDDYTVDWFIVFIEDSEPFESNILQADEDDIEDGMQSIVTQLQRFRACQKSGKYFGYTCVIDEPHRGILPLWHRQQMNKGR